MGKQSLAFIAYTILLLFFIQLSGTLIESIYILDLLKTSLDEKVLGVLFFFSPAILLFFRKKDPRWLLWLTFGALFLARGVLPYLNTTGRLLASGIGTSAALILMPLLLTDPKGFQKPLGSVGALFPAQGLALGIGLSVLLRTVNYTLDVTLTPAFGWIGWLLGVFLGVALAGVIRSNPSMYSTTEPTESTEINENSAFSANSVVKKYRGVTQSSIGILAVLSLVYFAFSSPGVIARWTEVKNYTVIVSVVSLTALGWLFFSFLSPSRIFQIRPGTLTLWNLLFTIALTGTILAHSVGFPATPESIRVVTSPPVWYQQVPLAFMLILSPVIFYDFVFFSNAIVIARPTPRRLALGFLLGALFLVLLVFMNIFSNVWGYVEPVSTYFRGKFWLPFALAGGLLTILAAINPLAHINPVARVLIPLKELNGIGTADNRVVGGNRVIAVAFLGAIFLTTLLSAALTGRPSPPPPSKDTVRVMTYNIQQANDASGERSYLQQLALIREVDPDVLALQESDSARISLGNNDYARYYAGKLGYHLYYGPKTVTGTYGTALLSKFPLENPRTVFSFSDQDEVGTTEAEIAVGDRRLTLYNVHPAGSDRVMLAFAETLLARAATQANVIALGDYNLQAGEEAYEIIAAVYENACSELPGCSEQPGSFDPIDHIFVSPHLEVLDAVYLPPPESATDHPAHWADIGW